MQRQAWRPFSEAQVSLLVRFTRPEPEPNPNPSPSRARTRT